MYIRGNNLFIVSVSTLKQKVKILVDNTDVIKKESIKNNERSKRMDDNMIKFNAGMESLTNFVKVRVSMYFRLNYYLLLILSFFFLIIDEEH